jgi:UDP-N-acetylglucosamine--N-acetylmuramyl-(pentapeptide) pyrophosphoryl-undecaprenol N-acetylglucosamine transferase
LAGSSITSDPTVWFAGGGSGGHLYPGIAVAQAMVEARPEVRPLFLCTAREIDRVILGPTGFEFVEQPIVPPRKSVGGLLRFWKAWRETSDLVQRLLVERPASAVLGLGGYAAGVAVKHAAAAGTPAGVLNPDVVPGKANAYLMRRVGSVFCGFEATLPHVAEAERDKCVVTGCPLRKELVRPRDAAEAKRALGLDADLSTLVVTGASQGARTVNEAVVEVVRRAGVGEGTRKPLQGWQVLHLAGRELADAVRADWRDAGLNGRAKVIDFTPDMGDVWSAADLAVCRAGASTCAEVLAAGVPAILMPYPFHKDMHQRANAQALVDAGAAVLLEDRKDRAANAQGLAPALDGLLYNADRRSAMSRAARSFARPDAARHVARTLLTLIGRG